LGSQRWARAATSGPAASGPWPGKSLPPERGKIERPEVYVCLSDPACPLCPLTGPWTTRSGTAPGLQPGLGGRPHRSGRRVLGHWRLPCASSSSSSSSWTSLLSVCALPVPSPICPLTHVGCTLVWLCGLLDKGGGQQALPKGLAGHPCHSLRVVCLTRCSLCLRRHAPMRILYLLRAAVTCSSGRGYLS
jgi:hypothetical protein